ncbi:MAG: SDR family NAD(P)-dependent oxidoreductase [Polyangiaceae bacterium]|nr:SDR family NAD(P)-dependent oxidoreductase [Polyangiaceae bacterium]
MSDRTVSDRAVQRTRIAIVGGGFSGLGVGIELLEQGVRDFVILEKASQLGGTWRENTYPGCACDVPSHLYSYSFERKADWSRVFAEQPEIQAYLLDVAKRRGVMPYVHLQTEALCTQWDKSRKRWRIETNRGVYDAQFVVFGPGPLHEPRLPSVPGIERFSGTTFHSAQWRHDHDLAGKRVAVLGTGSSAIQFVPKIQPKVERLFVFQRTAPWVLPKPDHRIPAIEQWALRNLPGFQWSLRQTIYGATELLQLAQRSPRTMQRIQKLGLWHLRRQVQDPKLREALTPNFTLGCKRLLLSNTYYPAIQAPNAELIPRAVTEITDSGVVGADGIERKVDTIIFGTGFHVTDNSAFGRVIGSAGTSLEEAWGGSPEAYMGTVCNGFPNAFFMIGPNLGNGHGSAFVLIEAQARYIADAIKTADRERIAMLEVRRSVQRAFNEEVQAALSTTVFNAGGCASYYIDKNGRNSSIYPWTTVDLRWRLRKFDVEQFEIEPAEVGERRPRPASPPRIDLAGAVVAITGAARGIGLATAKRFLEEGAIVCIGDLDHRAALEAAVSLGPKAYGFHLDVSQRASYEAFVEQIETRLGPIDVLVNNAGVMPTGRFLDETDGVDEVAMSVNHFGTAIGMKLVLPKMIARGRGHMVNVASLAGKFEVPYMASYVASKHATIGLTGAVRAEIEGSGVTLTTVMPGVIKTRLSDGISLDGTFAREPDDVARAIVDSCRTRQADVVVPGAFSGFVPLYAVTPRAVWHRLVGAFRAERIVDDGAVRSRQTYEQAIADQASTLSHATSTRVSN